MMSHDLGVSLWPHSLSELSYEIQDTRLVCGQCPRHARVEILTL